MHWIPIGAWIAAAAVAVVVLGFCAYEITWKAKRLRTDVGDLLTLRGRLGELQASIVIARERLATVTAGRR